MKNGLEDLSFWNLLGDLSFENWSSGDFFSFSFLQEKQDLISSQLIFITHGLPLFDLCIWWLRYVWTYSCKSLTQKKFIVYPMKLCGAKVWNYLTGFDVGYLTWMRHSWMPLIYKLKHDFENLDFWKSDLYLMKIQINFEFFLKIKSEKYRSIFVFRGNQIWKYCF